MKASRPMLKKVLWSFMLVAGLAVLFYGCGINPPVVTAITVTPEGDVVVGGTVALSCEASTQSTVGLTYEWSCDGGVLASGGKNASWTAPDTPGTYAITVRVTDNAGNSTTSVVYIRAIASQLAIVSINVSPASTISLESYATISCDATTPTGNTITFRWTDDPNGGHLSSTTGNPVTWTAPSTAGTYTVNVEANDTKTTVSSSVSIDVKSPPIITALVANPSEVTSGGSSSLECIAYDPTGGAIIYDWSCSGGSISAASSSGNLATWRPPSGASSGTIYTIYVTVSTLSRALSSTKTASINFTSPGNPIITTVTGLPSTVAAGSGAQSVSCTVSNISNEYIIKWTCSGGTITDDSSLSTFWTPPTSVTERTTYTVTLTITDTTDFSITSSKTFSVIVTP